MFPLLTGAAVAGLVWFASHTTRRAEAAVPPQGQFMEIDGQRLHYVDAGGPGPAIVMIHGLGGSLRHYTYALVEKLSGDFRVVAVDRPGSGYSTRPHGAPANLNAQAATLAKFMQALDLEKPLLVGHSLGGALALAIALNHPERAGGLALIAPLTHVQNTLSETLRGLVIPPPAIRRIVAWTVAVPLLIPFEPAMQAYAFGPDRLPADFSVRGGGLLERRPRSFCNTSADLMAVNDDLPGMAARYGSLAIPIGMLYATGDRLLDYRTQGLAMKRRLPEIDLVLLDGSGHMLPVTEPDSSAGLIRSVAARMPGRRFAAG